MASTTFTNWNLFPFDSYTLRHSGDYLDGMIRICGVRSPKGVKFSECDTEKVEENLIVSNVSDIKPSDALTPSLEPMSAPMTGPMTAEQQSKGLRMPDLDLMDDEEETDLDEVEDHDVGGKQDEEDSDDDFLI